MAGSFPKTWREALLFFPNDVLAPMGVVLLLCLAAWALTGVRLRSPVASFYAIVTFVLYGAIEYLSLRAGAMPAFIPVYAWSAVLFGVALHRLLAHLERTEGPGAAVAATVVLAAAVVQLAMFTYNPGRYLPSPAVQEARQRFIDQVRAIPGDVYVVDHNFDALMAGKQPHAEEQSVGTVMDMPGKEFAAEMRAKFDESLRSHRYSAVIVDGSLLEDPYGFHDAYPYAVSAEEEDVRFLTSQPSWILLPCETAASVVPW